MHAIFIGHIESFNDDTICCLGKVRDEAGDDWSTTDYQLHIPKNQIKPGQTRFLRKGQILKVMLKPRKETTFIRFKGPSTKQQREKIKQKAKKEAKQLKKKLGW